MPRAVRVQARVDFQRRGHARRAGEIFDADQLTAFLLGREGYVRFVRQMTPLSPPAVAPAGQAQAIPIVVAEEKPTPTPEPEMADDLTVLTPDATAQPDTTEKPRQRYRRRDLKAENVTGADEA